MPPKKKETSKKPEAAKPPTLINGLTKDELSKEQMEDHIMRLREELEREREERNYFQLERDRIQSFWEVTNRKLEEAKAELKNLEKAIEDQEAHHQVEIKVFKQKTKHLHCEHQNLISELESDTLASAEVLQDEWNHLEAELYKEQITILFDIQQSCSEDIFKNLHLKHEKEMAAAREKWERLVTETVARNKAEIQQLQQEQDNMMKAVICEQELFWNGLIDNLNKDSDKCLTDAKEDTDELGKKTTEEADVFRENWSKMELELKAIKKASSVCLKENKQLAGRLAETKEELFRLERRSKFFSHSEQLYKIPEKKQLKDLRKDHDDLEQKFSKLQIEMDELRSSVHQKTQADPSLRPLEDKVQALKDRLEQTQAQLHSVLSAPNVDQNAVAEISYKVEKDMESRNSAIKDLKHKKYGISQARRGVQLRTARSITLQEGLE